MTDEREGLPSASAMYRVVSCPGSVALVEACKPPELTTVVAKQGTQIHDALYTGDTYALDDESAEIAENLKESETGIVNDWRKWLAFTCHHPSTAVEQWVREERIWIRDKSLNPICSAKPDYVTQIQSSALIIDFKTGFLPVTPAEKNWQLRTQAVAVHQEYGATHIRVAIASARLGKPHVDFVDYTLEDLKNAERDLLFQLWKAKQPDAPRHAGDWCKYCPAKAYCREAAAWSAVDVVSPTQTVTTKEQISLAVESMTPEQLVHVWRKRNIVEGVLDAIKARLKALPTEELETLGLRLKEGKKMTSVELNPSGYNMLLGWIDETEILTSTKLSLDKVSSNMAARNKMSKKDARQKVLEILQDFVTESRGEPTLEEI